MEEYNRVKDYPIGTIINTKYGKAIVEEGDGYCGNPKCIFYTPNNRAIDCSKKCVSSSRKDKQCIYFKPIKEEDMEEKRNIKISLKKAKEWYNSGDDTLKDLALQVFNMNELEESKLPKSWKEYLENPTISSPYYTLLNNLEKLLILRDIYRQGWKPDWKDTNHVKYVIDMVSVTCDWSYQSIYIFSFPTRELAEQFLDNFRNELEELKELL